MVVGGHPLLGEHDGASGADAGDLAYLNFDLIIRNPGAQELKVSELRAVVLDAKGQMIERRLIWQQSLGLLAPDRTVPAKGEAMIFNPILLRSAAAGTPASWPGPSPRPPSPPSRRSARRFASTPGSSRGPVQAGQPASQAHAAMRSAAPVTSSSCRIQRRSDRPTPPGTASYR